MQLDERMIRSRNCPSVASVQMVLLVTVVTSRANIFESFLWNSCFEYWEALIARISAVWGDIRLKTTMNVQPSNPNNPIVFFDVTIGGQVSLNPTAIFISRSANWHFITLRLFFWFFFKLADYLSSINCFWVIQVAHKVSLHSRVKQNSV